MHDGTWTRERRDGMCVLSFDAPATGTISHRSVGELEHLLGEAIADRDRFVVLTGTGEVFVRHADLDDLLSMAEGTPTTGDPSAWIRVLRILDRGPFITVAAINGQAWGGGFELALTCNLRIAAQTATFAFPEVALGILPGVAAHRVVAALPEGRAIELFVTGRSLSAQEALAWGLLSDVVDASNVLEAALDLCAAMAQLDHESVIAARDLVIGFRDLDERGRRRLQSDRWDVLASRPVAQAMTRDVLAAYRSGADSRTAFGLTDWEPASGRTTERTSTADFRGV